MTLSFIRREKFKILSGPQQLTLGTETKLMGIVNVTPDSFSNDGCIKRSSDHYRYAIKRAQKMAEEGADIIDIGGESSRPGSKPISEKEEIRRVIPVIQGAAKKISIPISADTYKPRVAQNALDAGAMIINTIQGVKPDKELLRMVRNYDATIVLMHMRGTPLTMQKSIRYKNVISDIIFQLKDSVEICLENGIKSDKIILDPGIGFGKTVEDNLKIIHHLSQFKIFKRPILIGPSRKSFIGKILNTGVEDRLIGTIASIVLSIAGGAHIVRVHDVKEAKQAAAVADAIINTTAPSLKVS